MPRREFAWSTYEEKDFFLYFFAQNTTTNHLVWRQITRNVRKWRLVEKILRENMRDICYFKMFLTRQTLNTPPKKDGQVLF